MEYTHGEAFERRNLTFIYLEDYKTVDSKKLKNADAFVLDCSANQFVHRAVNSIKSAKDSNIYLRPLLLFDDMDVTAPITRASADGVIQELDNLGGFLGKIRKILERVDQVNGPDDSFEVI